ncbi:unnamed protein product [Euphydryas editha]|uniref:YqaJ viral recombinase domain-containing protein n=1 Tax=Euphydryas editha TaxID=104508 RepID=A0AAU9TY53_EUPED|nr:unnamed protein product [Euphydryas editha]
MFCYTNNKAEQFNSVVAKVIGGKRINYSLKDSYAARCYAAVVIFNTGLPQYYLHKSILNKSPGKSLKTLERKRHLANSKRTETGSKRCRKQLQFGSADSQYGSQCQRPDMTCDDYKNAKTLFLSNLQKQTLNRQEIERSTVLQAESALWLELRRCILTASMFSKICKRRPNTDSAPLVKTLLYSYNLDNVPSIKHGKENESKALAQLSDQMNIDIKKCGLFISTEHFFLGATPDGVFEDGVVEIKCPISAYDMDPDTAILEKKIKCFKIDKKGEVVLNKNHDWYYQIQGQLNIANKNICLFAVWTGTDYPLKIVKVYKDQNFWNQKMLPKLIKFYEECVLPEIIDSRKARSMPLRKILF